MELEKTKDAKEEYAAKGEGLRYSGDVEITLMDGDRVVSKRKCHNTGCKKLFMFFANSLSGDWSAARTSRPCKIVLFKTGDDEALYDGDKKIFDSAYWTEEEKVSTVVLHDSAVTAAPIYVRTESGTVCIGYGAKYHFRIPYLCLANRSIVTKMAIYPEVISSLKEDMSAYYIVDEGEGIQVPDAGGNFTIIVDWTLNITNADN